MNELLCPLFTSFSWLPPALRTKSQFAMTCEVAAASSWPPSTLGHLHCVFTVPSCSPLATLASLLLLCWGLCMYCFLCPCGGQRGLQRFPRPNPATCDMYCCTAKGTLQVSLMLQINAKNRKSSLSHPGGTNLTP